MSSTQFWVGALVLPLVRWASSYLKKFIKLSEFDSRTKARVLAKSYPFYFGFLYTLLGILLISVGLAVLLVMMIYGSSLFPEKSFFILTMMGLINMVGAWFLLGALLVFFFWQISPPNFRDYVIFRQIRSGWNYQINQQILILLKIGLIYYLATLPLQMYLIFF